MSYLRVIPRDLFNEASLLKCAGRVAILLDETSGHDAELVQLDDGAFDIQQDEADGSIHIANLRLVVGGLRFVMARPLNSRRPWPLYLRAPADQEFDEIDMLDDAGNWTAEMRAFLTA